MIIRRITFFAACAFGILISPQPLVAAQVETPVWHWFSECNKGDKVELKVLLDGVAIYKSLFPACSMLRGSIIPEPKQRILEFTLPAIANKRLRAPAKITVEGNIWEAESDPDAILIGVSFATKDQVLLNSVHIAKMGKTTSSHLAPGLVVMTTVAK